MGKKKFNKVMSPDEAMEFVNAMIEGTASLSEMNNDSDDIRSGDLFGLENHIFEEKHEIRRDNTFRDKATSNKNKNKKYRKPTPKVAADLEPDLPEEKIEEEKTDTHISRKFNITGVASFERAVICDGVSSYPFSLSVALSEDIEDFDINEASSIIEMLRKYIVSRSFPVAIYTKSEFKNKNFYEKEKFLFFTENDYVYSYIVDSDAWNELDSVISTEFTGDDKENIETYVKAYVSLALFVNEKHISFYNDSELYVEVYKEDSDANLKEVFEDEYSRDIQVTDKQAVPLDLDKFNKVIANVIANLIGENDEDDDYEDEEEYEEEDEIEEEIGETKDNLNTTLDEAIDELEEEIDETKNILNATLDKVIDKIVKNPPSEIVEKTKEELKEKMDDVIMDEKEIDSLLNIEEEDMVLPVIKKKK